MKEKLVVALLGFASHNIGKLGVKCLDVDLLACVFWFDVA